MKKISRYLKKIEKRGDDFYINDKYLIDRNGIIYYAEQYAGDTKKDFPLWVFKLKEALFN